MFKEALRNIEGIATLPVIFLVLFLIVFVMIVIYAMRLEKNSVKKYAAMPLDDETEPSSMHGD